MGRRLFALAGRPFFAASAVLLSFAFVFAVHAAPHNGEEFSLSQPDGSSVRVVVWGDEFYQDVESPDGYTLVRDKDGWICYAELSADGSEYVSTGVRYTDNSRAPMVRKGVRIHGNSIREKRRRNREALGRGDDGAPSPRQQQPQPQPGSFAPAPPDGISPLAAPKKIVGLTLLINFPDTTAGVSVAAMNDFCNRAGGYNGSNTAGSPRDYFLAVSNGLLDYSNIVTPFVVVDSGKQHYDRGTNYQYVPELIHGALTKLKAMNFDLSEVTTEGSGNSRTVTALNVFYAGSATQGWANGIWPHQGSYRAPTGQTKVTINGVGFGKYQLSSLGRGSSPPGIGTFVHENGHMVMGWPDLYSYDSPTHSNNVGNWCVMNSGSGSTPVQPNPYFRALAGWIDTANITTAAAGTVFTHASNGPSAYLYRRAGNNQEYYIIEARRKTAAAVDPRNSSLPGSGLAVWHIHTGGNNTTATAARPLVALVQADGNKDMENKKNAGDATDLFRASLRVNSVVKNTFSKTTAPAAAWHDGVTSNIDIVEISDSGAQMTFRIGGASGPATYYLTVSGGTGGQGYYAAGAKAAISAPAENSNGRYFLRWTSATLEPENAYAAATTVTTLAAEATVTANYVRGFPLPGQVEADTGYLQGITSASNTANGATGNRVARITDTARYAEYAVDIAESGVYRLSYRLLLTRNYGAGSFRLLDMTNGVVLDTVNVPAVTTTAMQTRNGKEAVLAKGRAVWRIEPISGAYSIDWFAAEAAGPAPVVKVGERAPLAYGLKAAPSGSVSFQIPSPGHVSVRMYDMRGRMVAVLCDGVRGPGAYSVNVSPRGGAGLSRGLYVIKMKSGAYSKDVRFGYNR